MFAKLKMPEADPFKQESEGAQLASVAHIGFSDSGVLQVHQSCRYGDVSPKNNLERCVAMGIMVVGTASLLSFIYSLETLPLLTQRVGCQISF